MSQRLPEAAFAGARLPPGLPGVLLALAGVAVYANSISAPFHFDDAAHILGNPRIERLWPPWPLLAADRPLVELSLALNFAVGGRAVAGYHAVNVLVHVLASLALFALVRHTLRLPALGPRPPDRARGLAFAVALLWLVHPLQTQAVSYVIQRGEALMGLFYLLTLLCAARRALGGRAAWSVASVLCCALGMASKETMVTAPAMVLLYDRTFLGGSLREAWRRRRGLTLGLASTWILLALLVAPRLFFRREALLGSELLSPLSYALTQPGVLLHYLRLAVFPHPLVFDYGWPAARGALEIGPPAVLLGALVLATAAALWRRAPAGFLGTWFLLILLPTSSVVPLEDVAVEHRMYLSLAAVSAFAVLGAERALRTAGAAGSPLGVLLLAAVAGALGLATWQRNADYRDPERLWRGVTEERPDNPRGFVNLGRALSQAGRREEAVGLYRRAIELRPDHAGAHFNLANDLLVLGRMEAALPHYREALRIAPGFVAAHANHGVALARRGRVDEAVASLGRALELAPGDAQIRLDLADALTRRGARGDRELALDHYREALTARPDDPRAHNALAWLLATRPGSSPSELDAALLLAGRAVELTRGAPSALDTLAAARAAAGDFAGAREAARRALRTASRDGPGELAGEIRVRLALYERGLPYRERSLSD